MEGVGGAVGKVAFQSVPFLFPVPAGSLAEDPALRMSSSGTVANLPPPNYNISKLSLVNSASNVKAD